MKGTIKPLKGDLGGWRIRYDLPANGSGKRQQKSETLYGTLKQAQRTLRERINAAESGSLINPQRQTVAAYLTRWLTDSAAAHRLKPGTVVSYQSKINRHIIPRIGQLQLTRLNAQQIQGIYTAMFQEGLKPQTALNVHGILKKALNDAAQLGLLLANPMQRLKAPHVEQEERKVWTREELLAFWQATEAHRLYDLFRVAALTGMRRGELCGLKWANVDLKGKSLKVVCSLQRVNRIGLLETRPKTAQSLRDIALNDLTVAIFQEVKRQQDIQRRLRQDFWHNTNYVFTNTLGGPLDPEVVSKEFKLAVGRAGVTKTALHGMRHLHASLLMQGNVNLFVISRRLGHSNISTTANIYTHLLPETQQASVIGLDKVLGDVT